MSSNSIFTRSHKISRVATSPRWAESSLFKHGPVSFSKSQPGYVHVLKKIDDARAHCDRLQIWKIELIFNRLMLRVCTWAPYYVLKRFSSWIFFRKNAFIRKRRKEERKIPRWRVLAPSRRIWWQARSLPPWWENTTKESSLSSDCFLHFRWQR